MLWVRIADSGVLVEERSRPSLGDGDILVKMHSCGLCGSDLEKVYGKYAMQSARIGHEPAGEVVEVGKDVNKVDIGDRIFVHHHVSSLLMSILSSWRLHNVRYVSTKQYRPLWIV